ncbi:ATPase family AAA domain-containing protein 1-A [Metarhizium album ARSEF 1941]|uniref:ATPase family AAA domain-containing protein 1-A n=1 Tax=Metarhizium album (strain ARSEF 1941) TaxID=1081103 RepID=A0A0B2WTV9_METAS|nr:ATPase family AAA domain-containing protein 1-A [Metarhizium album ARSEF 1941]KHN97089.1 ATPase family AAA domain-containing protein 1-A [Metarhizium album ARSEF 1941]
MPEPVCPYPSLRHMAIGMSQRQAPASGASMPSGLPPLSQWFLANNVKTPAELNKFQLPHIFSDGGANVPRAPARTGKVPAAESVAEKTHHAGTTAAGDARRGSSGGNNSDVTGEEPDVSGCRVPGDKLAELRDVTASFLVRDPKGSLLEPSSTVLLNSHTDDMQIVDGLVLHLAKELQATLVSVDLEDLQDLGYEFGLYERRAQLANVALQNDLLAANKSVVCGMALRYFGASPQNPEFAASAQERTTEAINMILDLQLPRPPSKPSVALGRSSGVVPSSTFWERATAPPLFIHIRDIYNIINWPNGARVLLNFQRCIRTRRSQGLGVVLLISQLPYHACRIKDAEQKSDKDAKQKSRKDASESLVPIGQQVDIIPTESKPELGHRGLYKLLSQASFRRFKALLRWHVPHFLMSPDVLVACHPSSTWRLEDDTRYKFSICVAQDPRKFLTQIKGRAYGKGHANLDDVRAVLLRLGWLIRADAKVEAAQEPVEQSVDRASWNDEMRRIAETADKHEKSLMECIVRPDEVDYTYEDVVMDQETKEIVQSLVSLSTLNTDAEPGPLMRPLRIKGALLYGPPGTGKTHLCRAIAKASGTNMLAIASAEMQSQHIGESEKLIKAAFKLAKKLFPCVLLIDDADALFSRRSSEDNDWRRPSLTQFLIEMDGLSESNEAPFVMVATNRPQDLDDAFYRRLPQKIYFGLPDEESRAKILRLILREEELDPLVDIDCLARKTDKYSGSDLRNLCAEAAHLWAMEQRKTAPNGAKMDQNMPLSVRHFEKALQKMRPTVSDTTMESLAAFTRKFGVKSSHNSGSSASSPVAAYADLVRQPLVSIPIPPPEEDTAWTTEGEEMPGQEAGSPGPARDCCRADVSSPSRETTTQCGKRKRSDSDARDATECRRSPHPSCANEASRGESGDGVKEE